MIFLILVTTLLTQHPAPTTESGPRRWKFDDDPVGKPPPGVNAAVGSWTIAAEGYNRVLAQTAVNSGQTYNVALFDGAKYRDVDVSVRLKPMAGKEDQGGGVAWRARDGRNYYVCRFNPLENNFRVYKVEDGKRTMFQTADIGQAPGWRSVRAVMRGDHIQCFFDGMLLLDVHDRTFPEAGRVGVWTKADAQTWFDELYAAPPLPERAARPRTPESPPEPTRRFEIRNDRAFLDGAQVRLWGVRWGNALRSDALLQRHVHCLDDCVANGVNLVGVSLQASNGGWPNPDLGHNALEPDGSLRPEFAHRLERFVREADRRGMVVLVGVFTPRKDQELAGESAVQRGLEQTADFLVRRKLQNVFVDLMHEYNNPTRADLPIFREPDGAVKKARLAAWFHAVARDIPVGVCPCYQSGTGDAFAGMGVRIIQKDAQIPAKGFVVNVEMQREDAYENEGVYHPEQIRAMESTFERYRQAPNAALLFHSCYTHGIGGKAGTGPNPEIGGAGLAEDDRGSKFYFDWVKRNVGVWSFPKHVRPPGG